MDLYHICIYVSFVTLNQLSNIGILKVFWKLPTRKELIKDENYLKFSSLINSLRVYLNICIYSTIITNSWGIYMQMLVFLIV